MVWGSGEMLELRAPPGGQKGPEHLNTHQAAVRPVGGQEAHKGRQHCRDDLEESRSRRYNSTVLAGKPRAAVRGATNWDRGGVLFLDDVCTKSGLPVLEVLKGKHPDTCTPDPLDPGCKAFKPYTDAPEVVPLDITVEDVERIASHLSGAGGAGGTDAVNLRNWLLRFGASSEELRDEMA
eukprot:3683092-Ditylum_brightwellii.AAC.1